MYKPVGAALGCCIAPLWGCVANRVRLILPDFLVLNITPMGCTPALQDCIEIPEHQGYAFSRTGMDEQFHVSGIWYLVCCAAPAGL